MASLSEATTEATPDHIIGFLDDPENPLVSIVATTVHRIDPTAFAIGSRTTGLYRSGGAGQSDADLVVDGGSWTVESFLECFERVFEKSDSHARFKIVYIKVIEAARRLGVIMLSGEGSTLKVEIQCQPSDECARIRKENNELISIVQGRGQAFINLYHDVSDVVGRALRGWSLATSLDSYLHCRPEAISLDPAAWLPDFCVSRELRKTFARRKSFKLHDLRLFFFCGAKFHFNSIIIDYIFCVIGRVLNL